MSDKVTVNVEVIQKIVRDMLANHELEAVLVVRDRTSKEVLYEVGAVNVVPEDIVIFRHVVGVVEVSTI